MNIQEIVSASAQIKDLLSPLAEKLGQTAQYTFGLFVKQVYVNAFTGLLWLVPGGVLLWLSKWGLKRANENKNNFDYPIYLFLIGLVFILGLVLTLLPLTDLIQALVNPEYQAIKLILETIKK